MRFPLSTLRLKSSKTTVLVPVTSSTTLSALRTTLLEALVATTSANADDETLLALPDSAKDIALWRLEPLESVGAEEAVKWVKLTDEKSGADKWGVSEAEEIGFSFKAADDSFPPPEVSRPVDEYDE